MRPKRAKRDAVIQTNCRQFEKQAIDAAAVSVDLSTSEFVRSAALLYAENCGFKPELFMPEQVDPRQLTLPED